jgi:hypothetical protein
MYGEHIHKHTCDERAVYLLISGPCLFIPFLSLCPSGEPLCLSDDNTTDL